MSRIKQFFIIIIVILSWSLYLTLHILPQYKFWVELVPTLDKNEAEDIAFGYLLISFIYHFFIDILFGFLKLRQADFKQFLKAKEERKSKHQKLNNLKEKWKLKLKGSINVDALYYFLDNFDIDTSWTPIGIVEEKPFNHVDNSTKGFWLDHDDFMDKNPFSTTICFYRLLKVNESRKEDFNNEIYIWKRYDTLYDSLTGNYGYLLIKLDNGDLFRILIEG
jgi:hypothetical protein